LFSGQNFFQAMLEAVDLLIRTKEFRPAGVQFQPQMLIFRREGIALALSTAGIV